MRNFVYNDSFCFDIGDLISKLDNEYDNDNYIDELSHDWSIEVYICKKEPIFNINAEKLANILIDCNEERIGENFNSEDEKKIIEALSECVDFEKLKTKLPQYYYPDEKAIIRKSDLVEWIKNV